MDVPVKQIFKIGDRQYQLVLAKGLISREKRTFPVRFDHERGLLIVSDLVPLNQRAWVVAVAVSDACFRQWRPVPVVWPGRWCDESPGEQRDRSPPKFGAERSP